MKLTCNKEKLLQAVTSVENIVKSKLNFSHLANILLTVEEEKMIITANNSELSQCIVIDAEVAIPGKIVLPHNKLTNLLRQFPNGNLSITLDKNNVTQLTPSETKRNLKASLLGIPADDFPNVEEFPRKKFYTIEKSYFRKMINKVVFAVSSQPTRYALHGVFFDLHKNQLTMVATDTRKMALYRSVLPSDQEESLGIIIPHETLSHLQKILVDEGPINFMITKNRIFFKSDNLKIASNLINGEFPKYEMLLPKSHEFTLTAKTSDLINAINVGNSILDNMQAPKIIWKIQANELILFSQESNHNQVDESIPVEFSGEGLEMAFNAKMLLEVMRNIDSEEVVFHFNNETSPVIIKEKDRNESTYVIMPVKLSV